MIKNKKIFKVGLVLGLVLNTSLFASSDNNLSKNKVIKITSPEVITINRDSKAGKEIFKNHIVFLKKLQNNQIKNKTLIYLVNQIQKDQSDIDTLKVVIAKLIQQINKQKTIINLNQKTIINLNKKIEIQSSNINDNNIMLEKLKNRLYKQNKQNKQINNSKDLISPINSTDFITLHTNSKSNNILKTDVKEKKCNIIKVKVKKTLNINIQKIKNGFYHFSTNKKFVLKENAKVFKYPVFIKSFHKNNEIIKKDTSVIADMYNKYGWVHVKNRGWIRGFLLFPKFLPIIKINLNKKNNNLSENYVFKKICK